MSAHRPVATGARRLAPVAATAMAVLAGALALGSCGSDNGDGGGPSLPGATLPDTVTIDGSVLTVPDVTLPDVSLPDVTLPDTLTVPQPSRP